MILQWQTSVSSSGDFTATSSKTIYEEKKKQMSTCIHVKRQYYRHPDFDPKCEEAKAELSPSHKGHEWKDSFACSFFFFFLF